MRSNHVSRWWSERLQLERLLIMLGFTVDWINDIIRMLKISVDYSEDSHHDNLVRNALLQLCLSILNHLGFRGESEPRSFGSKFAMLALNARNIVILITIASNTPVAVKEKLSPLDEPGKHGSCGAPS
jgi:mediator of RNA polymerase II transcription subunit 16